MRKKAVSAVLCAAMTITLLSGCGNGNSKEAANTKTEDTGEVDTIVMTMPTLGDAPADLEKIEAKINEITEEKIGVHLVMEPIPFADLSKTQNLMVSSGDQLDILLSLWAGGIGTYADKGAVIELTDLIEKYGQDITKAVGPSIAGGYYDGTLYGVPDGELWGHQYGFFARADIIDELGFEFDEDTVYSVEDLEALFAAYKEKYGEGHYCVAGTTSTSEFLQYVCGHPDGMGASSVGYTCGGLVDCLDKNDTTVKNVYATDEYMEYAQRMYDWAQKGYFSSDAATNTDSGTTQIASGNYLGQFNTTEKTTISQVSSACGTEMIPITLNTPFASTSMYQGIQWGITSNCEKPEKAMQMLNLLYSDPEVVSLLLYGIEGEHYEVKEQGDDYKKVIAFPEGINAMSSTYYMTLGVFGDHMLYPVWEPDTLENYDLMQEFDESVSKEEYQSVALGYAYNFSKMSTQYSAVSAVISQYSGAIATGSVDPDKEIPEFIKALENAGINDMIEDNQKQFDAWLAENQQ